MTEKPRTFAVAAALAVALVVVSYANHFHNAFHFDDAHVIEDNLAIRSLANVPRFFTDAATFSALGDHQTYRPLLSATYAIDYALGGGLNPVYFHASQLLFHLLVGAGVFLLVLRAGQLSAPGPANRYVALLASLWFCVHTGNTESVNYLSSRSDILSTLGIVGGFALYLWAPRSRRFHLYLIPVIVGATAKPPAVMFAPMLLAWILLFEEEVPLDRVTSPTAGARAWNAILRALPALSVGVALFLFVEGMNPEAQTYGGGSRLDYLRTQAWVWLHYARLFVLPTGLTADTDWEIIPSWSDTRVVVGLAGLALLAWVAVRASRTRAWRPVSFGLLWFALGLLPASSVFPLAEVANEHRIYLPFVGLALAASWAVFRFAEARGPGLRPGWAAAVALLLAAHVWGTVVRNQVWRTEESLWADVVEKSPGNGRAWMNYGLTQMEAGRYEEARRLFSEARDRWPAYAPIYVNLGIVTHRLGDTLSADAFFRHAIELRPEYALGAYYYGRFLVEAGRGPAALERLQEAVAGAPNYAPARHLLLALYWVIGSRTEVEALAQSMLEVFPGDELARAYLDGVPPVEGDAENLFDRGVELTNRGEHLQAGVAYRRYLEEQGTDADALLNLGWSQAHLGFNALAAIAFRQVLALRPDDALARNNLAWVEERMGGSGIVVP